MKVQDKYSAVVKNRGRTRGHRIWPQMLVCAMSTWAAGGCSDLPALRTQQRKEHGYTIILPGIEGRSYLNKNIANGLAEGGVPGAIEIYDWTLGGWFTAPYNLRALERNQKQARIVARRIVAYQDAYPDRPVHLIGHSGGGGVAILVLQALPANHPVDTAILLAPALAPDYDLRRALRRTREGIWNYYSVYDVGFLRAGTFTMGTVDGQHTSAAGAVGFTEPYSLNSEERQLYAEKLHQQAYTPKMAESGHFGGHTGWASASFVAEWLAPVILAHGPRSVNYASDADGG